MAVTATNGHAAPGREAYIIAESGPNLDSVAIVAGWPDIDLVVLEKIDIQPLMCTIPLLEDKCIPVKTVGCPNGG